MEDIKSKMAVMEWDRKKTLEFSKKHMYECLKKEYEELENKLEKKIADKQK